MLSRMKHWFIIKLLPQIFVASCCKYWALYATLKLRRSSLWIAQCQDIMISWWSNCGNFPPRLRVSAKLNCDVVESKGYYNNPLVEYCERFEDSIKFYTLILWYIVIAFLNFKFLIENPRDHTQLLYIILRILKKTTYNVRVHHFTFFKKSSNYVFGAYSKITYL